jgi:hypothetical protein
MNWWGSVKEMVPHHSSTSPSSKQTMESLFHFVFCLCKITLVVGGIITVVVVPKEGTEAFTEKSKHETIVAACLWLQPGQMLDGPILSIMRSGAWSVLRGWKWQGVKVSLVFFVWSFLHCIPLSDIFSQRIFFEFTPKVEHTLEVSFKSRNLRPEDSWHLLLIVVHPDHEGRGTHYNSCTVP